MRTRPVQYVAQSSNAEALLTQGRQTCFIDVMLEQDCEQVWEDLEPCHPLYCAQMHRCQADTSHGTVHLPSRGLNRNGQVQDIAQCQSIALCNRPPLMLLLSAQSLRPCSQYHGQRQHMEQMASNSLLW